MPQMVGLQKYVNDDDNHRINQIKNATSKEQVIEYIKDNIINMYMYYLDRNTGTDMDTLMIRVIGSDLEDRLRLKLHEIFGISASAIYRTNLTEERIECNYNVETGKRVLLYKNYKDLDKDSLVYIAVHLEAVCQKDIYNKEWENELRRLDAENKRNFLKKMTDNNRQSINIVKTHL